MMTIHRSPRATATMIRGGARIALLAMTGDWQPASRSTFTAQGARALPLDAVEIQQRGKRSVYRLTETGLQIKEAALGRIALVGTIPAADGNGAALAPVAGKPGCVLCGADQGRCGTGTAAVG